MLITNNHKIVLFTCNEIKNIFESIYGLNYSKSFISKTFIEIDAGIRVGRTDYIAEEFIQYLFFKKRQDLPSIKIKIAKRKEEILQDIDPELLELGLLAQKAKNKEVFTTDEERRAKIMRNKLIEVEILERIKQKKGLLYKYDTTLICHHKKFDSGKSYKDIHEMEDLIDHLINIMQIIYKLL
ncbi:hypothetical protein [Borrelia sp. P9F1]|uniref:hypothetical protein n=1 Tax=Borrelia sp. P9F1 TaxID=3058374 RepID=UPI002649A06D|nr:hypothetical protein [Borrelia sp. P9F1]WKC58580.1 hypothetical protein QYZ68_05105 [Borrelia sp. P9F1]